MLNWHRSKAATSLGVMRFFLPLFELCLWQGTSGKLSSEFKICSSSEFSRLSKLCVVEVDATASDSLCLTILSSSSNRRCLDLSSFFANFLSTPPKHPGRPGSLCFIKNNLSSSIFILFKASACAMSNKLSRSISKFFSRFLNVTRVFLQFFCNSLQTSYKSTSFFTQLGNALVGILAFSQYNHKICTFTNLQFNLANIVK